MAQPPGMIGRKPNFLRAVSAFPPFLLSECGGIRTHKPKRLAIFLLLADHIQQTPIFISWKGVRGDLLDSFPLWQTNGFNVGAVF